MVVLDVGVQLHVLHHWLLEDVVQFEGVFGGRVFLSQERLFVGLEVSLAMLTVSALFFVQGVTRQRLPSILGGFLEEVGDDVVAFLLLLGLQVGLQLGVPLFSLEGQVSLFVVEHILALERLLPTTAFILLFVLAVGGGE